MTISTQMAGTTTPTPSGAPASRKPLRSVANVCSAGSCPTVYTDGTTSTLIVQGFTVSPERAGIDLPNGESLIEIPYELLAEALRNLS